MSERYWVLIHFDAPCPPEAMGPFDREAAEAFIEKEGYFTAGETLVKRYFTAGYTLVKEVGGEDEQK